MYKKILTAVDEHLNSEISARYGMQLARIIGSRLFLCHIGGKRESEKNAKLAESAIGRLFHRAKEMGLDVESIVCSVDKPVETLRKLVISEGIDLVFAAARTEDVKRTFFAATTARSLSLRLPCSLALVRVVHLGRIHPKAMLIPLAGRISRLRERAYFAAMMATAFDSRLYLLHVTKPIARFFHGEIHLTPLEWEKRLPKDIGHFIDHLTRYRVPHSKKTISGIIARSITIEAATQRHDLIIMEASESGLLSSILSRSPVEDLLRETPCDLIIFRPFHEDK